MYELSSTKGWIAKSDEQRIAPGTDLLGAVLQEAGPGLILLDEILVYLVKAGGVRVGESTLRGNTLMFLQELSIAVANCPHAVMVTTLTSQLVEFFEEGAERVYESLEKVLGRMEKVRQTVEGTEIYEVIRRRLFENLGDTEEHKKTAEAYWAIDRKLGEDVPSSRREPVCRDDIIKVYPFHPELIHVRYERWGTIPEFQRTRGVLRLLADVIANLYQAKDNEALIQSGSVTWGRRRSGANRSSTPARPVCTSQSSTATSRAATPRPPRSTGNWVASTPRRVSPRSWPARPSCTPSAAGSSGGDPA